MTYGLNPQLFVEHGPAVQAAGALARSSSTAFRAWKRLNEQARLALVETALAAPANDLIDEYPIAL